MSEPEAISTSLPWWRNVAWICEHDKSGILKVILQYFGVVAPDGDRSLFLNVGSVNQGNRADIINADVNIERSVNNPRQSSTTPIQTAGFRNVYQQTGSANIYREVGTVNASVTIK